MFLIKYGTIEASPRIPSCATVRTTLPITAPFFSTSGYTESTSRPRRRNISLILFAAACTFAASASLSQSIAIIIFLYAILS